MTPQTEPPRYSHPSEGPEDEPILLREHLDDVAGRAVEIVPADATTPAGEPLDEIVRRLGLVHDIGKATTWFQQHIGVESGSPPNRTLRDHAPLGAFAAYYALDASDFDPQTCLAGFVAVAKHHGTLPNVVEYVFNRTHTADDMFKHRRNAIRTQVEDIHEHVPTLVGHLTDTATGGDGTWEEFATRIGEDELFDAICDDVSRKGITKQPREDALAETFYALTLQCWSTLVLADKTSAAGAPRGDAVYGYTPPAFETLDRYVTELEASTDPDGERGRVLNEYRAKARRSVLERVEQVAASDEQVARLTLPTGMGKTLTGLSAALRLREETDRDRVIYALPFTSIIDQVADEAKEIYGTDGGDDLLTIHHHLAESRIELDDGIDDVSGRIEAMLGESWRAGLTVTTFVQLFESLAGPQNSQSMKLPALHDSVVILDEPQSLPHGWWKLVKRLVGILTDQYGATVIAMTATQPRLFGEAATELVDDPRSYFDAVERVEYVLHESAKQHLDSRTGALDHAAAADELVDAVGTNETVLAVCNTIDSARELTNEFTSRVDAADIGGIYANLLEETGSPAHIDAETVVERVTEAATVGPAVAHLTTRIRPVDRLTLLKAITKLTEQNLPTLAISTQLIEAGVDISFERVYRDLAPLDSIVQAAGRCNRSFEQERGDVVVWWLDAPDDREQTPAVAVYDNWGPSLLPPTAAAMEAVRDEGHATLSERLVAWDAVEDYYRRLRDDKDVGRAAYVQHVDRAEATSLGSLSLIQQRQAADLLVCRTDQEFERVEEARTAWDEFDFDSAREVIESTRDLRISVPIYDEDSPEAKAIQGLTKFHPDSDVYVLDARPGRNDEYFDPTTGFVVDDTVEARFL